MAGPRTLSARFISPPESLLTSQRWLRFTALGALLAFSPVASGCFGSFALTRKMHAWNEGVSGNKFVQWLVFLGMTIIPVYGVGVFLDSWIFNSIEFWTDSNPMASHDVQPGETRVVQLSPGQQLRLTKIDSRGSMRVELLVDGQAPIVRTYVPEQDGMKVLDERGAVVAVARENAAGEVEITDAAGNVIALHDLMAQARVSELMASGGAAAVASEFSAKAQLSSAVCSAQ